MERENTLCEHTKKEEFSRNLWTCVLSSVSFGGFVAKKS